MLRSGTRVTSGIRMFGNCARLCNSGNSPIFDPSQLNPLSGTAAGASAVNRLEMKLPKTNETTQSRSQQRLAESFVLSPKEDAMGSRLTGVKGGRSVDVFNGDTSGAFRQLNSIVFANRIAQDRRNQRFHLKPGKAKELRRSQKHRRDFMKGFKRLIDIVKDAKRKGY
ncbi:LAFE_0B09406g1_1 [Lachancea fermentati]|uniref:LAFE_0B09406g1_1 n=1 Tax=Lachancea fermentati TaxID=4955 RepID=A0A1G4M8J5_LACFM|nr:LAFE_0B09406g1_1 [Lachancea fermentati]